MISWNQTEISINVQANHLTAVQVKVRMHDTNMFSMYVFRDKQGSTMQISLSNRQKYFEAKRRFSRKSVT